MATSARDIAGKVWAIFFPICAFVVGGFEHCVANMFYIPAGIMAAMNPDYVAKAKDAYGLTVEQIATLTPLHSLQKFYPGYFGKYDRWYVVRRTSALPDLQEKMELI